MWDVTSINSYSKFSIQFRSGFVDIENATSYVQHRTKYLKKGHGQTFARAVSQCDKYVKNPEVYN